MISPYNTIYSYTKTLIEVNYFDVPSKIIHQCLLCAQVPTNKVRGLYIYFQKRLEPSYTSKPGVWCKSLWKKQTVKKITNHLVIQITLNYLITKGRGRVVPPMKNRSIYQFWPFVVFFLFNLFCINQYRFFYGLVYYGAGNRW